MSKQHVHLVVDSEIWKKLKIESAIQGKTMTALIEELITNIGQEKDEPVLQETQMSRGDYRGVNLNPNNPIADKGGILNNTTKEPVILPSRAKPDTTPYQDIKEAYNLAAKEFSRHEGLAGFKTCRRLDTSRKRGIKRLLSELKETNIIPFEYFKLCTRNRHWCGDNDRGWRADIEFLTRDKNISAALELEEVDAAPQAIGNGVPKETSVENLKARIRAFVNSKNRTESEDSFLDKLKSQMAVSGLLAEQESIISYFESYTSYRAG